MLLSVIIVSYNTQNLTVQTIKSVVESTKNSKLLKNNLEIIVVDNKSTDDSGIQN
jgi:glycosyltransferase involved in cell wall biosynthesis